jgi:hypothetical protein
MNLREQLTIGDGAFIASLLILAGILFAVLPGWVISGGTEIVVISDDTIVGRYSLEEDRHIEVVGPLGTTRIELRDGRARITESPCPHKVCIEMGDVGKEGGIVVCVPNKVAISVGKQPAQGIDAVSR